MSEIVEKAFVHGGWLGVLALLALVVAYVKEKQVTRLNEQLAAERSTRILEAKETALLLHRVLSRYGPRDPMVSVHEDDDELILSKRDQLTKQANKELAPDLNRMLEDYLKDKG